jgi:hypothetical protein
MAQFRLEWAEIIFSHKCSQQINLMGWKSTLRCPRRGKERKGEERRGKERKGEERRGKERKAEKRRKRIRYS